MLCHLNCFSRFHLEPSSSHPSFRFCGTYSSSPVECVLSHSLCVCVCLAFCHLLTTPFVSISFHLDLLIPINQIVLRYHFLLFISFFHSSLSTLFGACLEGTRTVTNDKLDPISSLVPKQRSSRSILHLLSALCFLDSFLQFMMPSKN